jgi:hypothetical protein
MSTRRAFLGTLGRDELRHAHSRIEDDLTELLCAVGVLDLAHTDLSESGGNPAVTRSLHFTARGIEAIVRRIEAKLVSRR